VEVREAADAAEFLELTAALRGADPVRTNVLGSVATGVVQGRRYDDEHWLVVEDDSGAVVGAAVWTPPYRLLLPPLPPAAAAAVGRHVAGMGGLPPGVIGPREAVECVVRAAGWQTRQAMSERLLVLGDPLPPAPVPGSAREAVQADRELGTEWMRRFAVDADVLISDPEATFLGRLGSAWFWEVDGEPVAYASVAPLVDSPSGAVARIGPVFTAAEHRRRGFGAAVTWTAVQHAMQRAATVMLYTDAANPTSNGVYERLGFRAVAEVVDLDVL